VSENKLLSGSNPNIRVSFVCITMGHYKMAVQLLIDFRRLNLNISSQIFCSGLLHDQKNTFCSDHINSFDESIFINEFQYVPVGSNVWKLRGLIKDVEKKFVNFRPDIIITFTDNSYIYQHSFRFLKAKRNTKVVLFHEGYGDYSEAAASLRTLLPYYYIRVAVWPFTFRPVTRSYTGLYDYSCLLQPDLVARNFLFKKIQIPFSFMESVFYNSEVLEYELEKESIFLVLSGKDWANNRKLKTYLLAVLRSLKKTNRRVYLKTSPNVSGRDYQFLTNDNLVKIIEKPNITSESFCYHPNIKYIVTDESSAVTNAIFGGVKSTFFFLNEEIQYKGIYKYDKNDLLESLKSKGLIYQTSVVKMTEMIKCNFNNTNFIEDIETNNIVEELSKLAWPVSN
jgi:hypothetical protein